MKFPKENQMEGKLKFSTILGIIHATVFFSRKSGLCCTIRHWKLNRKFKSKFFVEQMQKKSQLLIANTMKTTNLDSSIITSTDNNIFGREGSRSNRAVNKQTIHINKAAILNIEVHSLKEDSTNK